MSFRPERCFVCILLLAAVLLSGSVCFGAEPKALTDGICGYLTEVSGAESIGDWAESELPKSAGQGAEWFVFALAQSGENTDFTEYYLSLKEYLENSKEPEGVDALRIALGLVAVGAKDDGFVLSAFENATGKQGIMSLVFGLHLANNGVESEKLTCESIVSEILSLQNADGGWALSRGKSDVDVTAMVLQALAPCRGLDGVEEAKALAMEFLAGAIQPNGEFLSYGEENAESAAQVILALTSWGIDPGTAEDFIRDGKDLTEVLAGYVLEDGSFCHVKGGNTTRISMAQSYCALVSVMRLREGRTSFFLMDAEPVVYQAESGNGIELGYKFWVCLGIALAFGVAVLTVILKKSSKKNILFAFGIAAICVVAVLFTDIRTEKDYFSSDRERGAEIGSVTMEIRCDSVAGRASHIPADGVILPKTEFVLCEGDTAYLILVDGLKSAKLTFESEGKNYISSIANIGEGQFGDLSGWLYYVNGERPSVGCGEFELSDGDEIIWVYSLEMGKDIEIAGN